MYVHVEEATTTSKLLRSCGNRTRAQNARYYGTSLWDRQRCAHYPVAQRCGECGEATAYIGTQMFGVALGCSSLLPPLECTWGKIVIIIKFRLVRSILRVDGSRGYFRVSVVGPGPLSETRPTANPGVQPAGPESRCNRCLGNHPFRDTSGSLGIP